jgi:cell wall-associated protease
MRSILFRVIILLTFTLPALAQPETDTTAVAPPDWFLKDPELDHFQGVSAEKAYSTLLQGQPSKPVLVAVIDSGIDTDHEDLKNIIWTNEKEIPNNGIDDDKNGYVDDIHGWNFIGGKNGNVVEDTYELTREHMRLKKKFAGIPESSLSKKEKPEYEAYIKIKDKFEKLKDKNERQYNFYNKIYANIKFSVDTLKSILKTEKLTPDMLEHFNSNDSSLLLAKIFALDIFKNIGPDADLNDFIAQVKEGVDYFKVIVLYGYNEDFDSRKIVGDNYSNLYEKHYGNNDVKGPDATHGTHVAGIIGADRKNNIGIKGIADNVRIMSVRAVPNGDERDKDIANAILYAVDNGAKIINMSFGKSFSPEKEAVDKAVKYAEQKGVLLIHAAGNDAENNDTEKNFPTRFFLNGKEAKNWIEVGASAWGASDHFVAEFSNYGKKSVDLFAPGVEIYSTTPDNTYKNESGTSMASPATAGVAAVLLSYFPELTTTQLKDILTKSTRKFDGLKVEEPGTKTMIDFNQLSSSGGLVNLYEAVKMAQGLRRKKEKK